MLLPGFRRHALFATIVQLTVAGAPGVAVAQAQSAPQRISPEFRAQLQATVQACQADARQYCQAVSPGGGRLLACLQSNAAQLSQPCRDALAKLPRSAAPGE